MIMVVVRVTNNQNNPTTSSQAVNIAYVIKNLKKNGIYYRANLVRNFCQDGFEFRLTNSIRDASNSSSIVAAIEAACTQLTSNIGIKVAFKKLANGNPDYDAATTSSAIDQKKYNYYFNQLARKCCYEHEYLLRYKTGQ